MSGDTGHTPGGAPGLVAQSSEERSTCAQAGRRTHELKCWPMYFGAVADGSKSFEVRRDDRWPAFRTGDVLHLREWHPDSGYSGRNCEREVTYVLPGGQFGIAEGYVVMGLAANVARGVGDFAPVAPDGPAVSGEVER